ncbi:MAG: plasmid pRiA4b ORF-3 family protein [Candidatus Bipolaricaulota bacterium]
MAPREVFQLRIALMDILPPIWRRIQIPTWYSFWDLHVAIQDAMGWLDYHLHSFRLVDLRQERLVEIGIPDDEFPTGRETLPGWETPVEAYLHEGWPVAVYEYDFGDSWAHVVQLEARLPARRGRSYPVCVAGERKCPPEDCGGVGGYAHLLEAIANPRHPEHKKLLDWVGGSYDPEDFDPAKVQFDDPKERWKNAFADDA